MYVLILYFPEYLSLVLPVATRFLFFVKLIKLVFLNCMSLFSQISMKDNNVLVKFTHVKNLFK